MRISKTLIIAFIISSSYTIITSSCKKEKNNTQSTTPVTPISPANYTEGSLMGITLISIPNSSLFYDANGADIYKEFCVNTTSNFIISSHNNPIVNFIADFAHETKFLFVSVISLFMLSIKAVIAF